MLLPKYGTLVANGILKYMSGDIGRFYFFTRLLLNFFFA